MLYLPKPKLSLSKQYKLNNKSYAFKEYAKQQQLKMLPRYFAADFECTTKEPYTVYMVTIEDIHTKEQWFYHTIDEFLMFCEMHPNSTFYFHNGWNYDIEFIINRVLQRSDWSLHQSKGISIRKKLNEWQVTAKGTKFKHNKGIPIRLNANIKFRDTTDVFTSSLKSLGESIGVDKGFGEIDTPLVARISKYNNEWVEQDKEYDEYVHHATNYQIDFLKNGWWHYAMQDTHVLAEVIRYYKLVEHGYKNEHTAAKIAYNELLNNDITYKEYVQALKESLKNEAFAIDLEQFNKFAKRAYRGGIAWTNALFSLINENKQRYMPLLQQFGKGYHLDYNSMYPAIYMLSHLYPLPTNVPTAEETDLYIIEYTNLHAKCPNDVFPLIKNRTDDIDGNPIKSPSARYYLHTVNERTITLTSVEDDYLHKYYKDITYDDCQLLYYNRHYKLEHALREHGNKWYAEKVQAKEDEDDARLLYAKMMLNSVYGYLGFFNKIVDTYNYVLNEDGSVTKEIQASDRKTAAESKKAVLGLPHAEVPAAAFITAYGRVKLAEDINRIGVENVVTTDTDSLFVINVEYEKLEELVHIDKYELGALDKEHEFTKIISLKPKTWCISDDDDIPIAQATAGSNYKFDNINDFYAGKIMPMRKKERGVGGVGLPYHEITLGELNKDLVDDYNASIVNSYD